MAYTRIKLASINIEKLNQIVGAIKEIATRSGVVIKGPIPLPTKKLKITVRRSPCGNGTSTFDRFEMRIHKRLIELPAHENVLHNIMRLPIPKEVNVEIEMIE
ncbi:MAG: 30S ribosomal protein S10 [Candidatus Pacearchaeota archaeon]|nr:30S ribosomal protein S10 [Candidatus Pacearchaeota archaeon]